MLTPAKEAILNLVNSGEPLLNSKLADLSNLNSDELRLVEKAWIKIEPKRQRQIMQRLVELAEDNVELNFNSIFKGCLEDKNAEVRCLAIEGLWENEEPALIEPLIKLLTRDNSEKVQAAAATALGRFALLAECQKLRSDYTPKITLALLKVLNDESKPIEIRRRALEASSLSLPEVKEAITQAYHSHDSRLKVGSLHAMGKSCDRSWLPIVIKELGSADAEMRYEAALASGELEAEEVLPHLVRLTSDPDIEVQLAAIQALGKIGGNKAKQSLKKCLTNPKKEIRQAAVEVLNELAITDDSLSFQIRDYIG